MKNHSEYLKFSEKDNEKFLIEMNKLSARAKNLLASVDMQTWHGFYYHLFVNHDIKDFQNLRNSGVKTKKELISFMRKVVDPYGRYDRLIKEFEDEFNRLNGGAKGILNSSGISLFEIFYYRLIINKEVIDFVIRPYDKEFLPDAEKFIQSACNYIGSYKPDKKQRIYFNPGNDDIIRKSGIKKKFALEFENLSEPAKTFLRINGNNNIYSFYTSFISDDSLFNKIFKDLGESDLLEILKLRSMLITNIKNKLTIR